MSLGARLKELRVQRNQSLQDVADAVGASKAHIWEIERGGSKNPTMDLLTKLASHLGVSVAYLVGEQANQKDAEAVAMFHKFRSLDDSDREAINRLMEHLKKKEGGG
ncbi:helix-turn-helix domain-containing protein (plasmid) [Bradyrhizobium sp. CCGUVB1N3]|uniref:helix-turn-helix domain-containing protein n=1 Tax=Bradyrhizobium sp. CCGUVB1N3 TaxID=2949629 RepID=UPI0020B43C0A|nr:helix-turn-helix transcriptional regulator [Bradyrhizobium sp. CCGUVB1N3]MCP3478035.1 helix-turn-helix domain-containing protein [Bradyrhizobium sp. CCGUVB1N3]